MIVWTLTNGHAGFESQVLGLAEAIGGTIVAKRARPRRPWTHIPASIALPPLSAVDAASDKLVPPWPDLLISCGRRTVGLALKIKLESAGHTYAVHIQDPLVDPGRFDLVAAPAHDGLEGGNVLITTGAVHRVTPEKLATAAEQFRPLMKNLPRPLVAVLVGGSNRRYRMTAATTANLCGRLKTLCEKHGAGLAATISRRTSAPCTAMLRERMAELPALVWDGQGDNPYLGFLALADAFVVTEDSVSMISEAASTGKPVYVAALEGGGGRYRRFHHNFRAAGITRPFDGSFDAWAYEPPNDTAKVAAEVRKHLAQRKTAA
ncbi:MAG: mitochondrial fission ELM1 family protein [Alphaproteobacteria bacterium]